MFLNFINFFKLKPKTSAKRNVTKYSPFFCFQKKFKFLNLKKKWFGGKNDNGKIIFRTRKSLLIKKKYFNINYNIRINKLSFISSFQFLSFKNKLLSLLHFSNGMVTYYLTTYNHFLFNYNFLNKKKILHNYIVTNLWYPLFLVKKLTTISCIEINFNKNAQYCLSPGSKSKLWNIDKSIRSVLIILPSLLKKNISFYSCVFLNKIALESNKKYMNTKSGYWRKFGIKTLSRGVAMNPVDHPHGGRTKAIQYQRTPWGFTTKYK